MVFFDQMEVGGVCVIIRNNGLGMPPPSWIK